MKQILIHVYLFLTMREIKVIIFIHIIMYSVGRGCKIRGCWIIIFEKEFHETYQLFCSISEVLLLLLFEKSTIIDQILFIFPSNPKLIKIF